VRYKTLVGYRTDVTRHLVPGLGAHRIDKLEPEHVEKLYGRMIRSGLAAGTVHHAHRTLRASLSEAVKRKHVALNVAMVAKPPRLDDEEIEPLTIAVAAGRPHRPQAPRSPWPTASDLAARLRRPPPVRHALPQNDALQAGVPAAQTRLSNTVSN
jgi:hypothetical protein